MGSGSGSATRGVSKMALKRSSAGTAAPAGSLSSLGIWSSGGAGPVGASSSATGGGASSAGAGRRSSAATVVSGTGTPKRLHRRRAGAHARVSRVTRTNCGLGGSGAGAAAAARCCARTNATAVCSPGAVTVDDSVLVEGANLIDSNDAVCSWGGGFCACCCCCGVGSPSSRARISGVMWFRISSGTGHAHTQVKQRRVIDEGRKTNEQ